MALPTILLVRLCRIGSILATHVGTELPRLCLIALWILAYPPLLWGEEQSAPPKLLFEAEHVTVSGDRVFLKGDVKVRYGQEIVTSNEMVFNEQTGEIQLEGKVRYQREDSFVLETEFFQASENFGKAHARGVNILSEDKTSIFAKTWHKDELDNDYLDYAILTACEICEDGESTWRLRARKIVWDKQDHRYKVNHMFFDVQSIPLFYFPYLSIPDSSVRRATGILPPTLSFQDDTGLLTRVPMFLALSEVNDLTITPLISFTSAPGLELEYRQAFASADLAVNGNLQPAVEGDDQSSLYAYFSSRYHHTLSPNIDLDIANDFFPNNQYHSHFDLYKIPNPIYQNHVKLEGLYNSHWFVAEVDRYDHVDRPSRDRLFGYSLPHVSYEGWFELPHPWGQLSYTFDLNNMALLPTNRQLRLINQLDYTTDHSLPFGFFFRQRFRLRGDLYHSAQTSENASPVAWRFMPQSSSEIAYPIVAFLRQEQSFTFLWEGFAGLAYMPIIASEGNAIIPSIQNNDTLGVSQFFVGHGALDRSSGYDVTERGLRLDYGLRYRAWRDNIQFGIEINQSYRPYKDQVLKEALGIDAGFDRLHLATFVDVPYVRGEVDVGIDLNPTRKQGLIRYAILNSAVNFSKFGLDLRYHFQQNTELLSSIEKQTLSTGVRLNPNESWTIAASSNWDLERDFSLEKGQISITYRDPCFFFTLSGYQGFDSYGDRSDHYGFNVNFGIDLFGDKLNFSF